MLLIIKKNIKKSINCVQQKVDSWEKKRDMFFNQNHNFLISNRVSWNLLTSSKPGTCWLSSGLSPAEIDVCAAEFADAASSYPERRQPFRLK